MKAFFRTCLMLLLCAMVCLPALASDGETLYSKEYCFSEKDFTTDVSGILIRSVPDGGVAVIRLGERCIRAGDVLSAERLTELRLLPSCQENCEAVLCYQPIHGSQLGQTEELVIKIRSGKNEAPKAQDANMETYKNIANNGTLEAKDPEGAKVEFQLAEKPKRGTVELKADGSYVYTPDKNKVGEDSFTFTATDEAGNVSQPATVKIKILKPADAMTFADMKDSPAQFEAMWASAQNLTGGMELAGRSCFCPKSTVSRADFLVMAMELTGKKPDNSLTTSAFADAQQAAAWVQPYLACAVRSGIVRGEVRQEGLVFRPNESITGQEAAVMLQNLLQLPVSAAATDSSAPVWAASALQALQEAGISMNASQPLTREAAVCLLYEVSKLD